MSIHDNILNIQKQIGKTKLVVVTKHATVEQITDAINTGIYAIGENRVQDALLKFSKLPPVKKHFIGHLQRNKVEAVVENFDVIESLDSIELAKEINKRTTKKISVMIQVNIGYEEQKFGIKPEDVKTFYEELKTFTNLDVIGLMCIAPHVQPEETRIYFRKMKKFQVELALPELSMGMSNDFLVAIEEGSTIVRVGTAIFSSE